MKSLCQIGGLHSLEPQCLEHTGIIARLHNLENDMLCMSHKIESTHKLLIGTLTSTCLSLLGIIFLLVSR